jgi:hypothetical protein
VPDVAPALYCKASKPRACKLTHRALGCCEAGKASFAAQRKVSNDRSWWKGEVMTTMDCHRRRIMISRLKTAFVRVEVDFSSNSSLHGAKLVKLRAWVNASGKT